MSDRGADQREVPQEKPRDLYGLLGVQRGATPDEVKAAFRKKALECHPDTHKGDSQAEEQFKAINEASSVLGNANNRAQYDRLGHQGYYQQTKGWNPIPEEPRPRESPRPRTNTPPPQEPRPTGHAEERQRPPPRENYSESRWERPRGGSGSGRVSDPFDFEEMMNRYADIFGFGKQSTGKTQERGSKTRYTEEEWEEIKKGSEQTAQKAYERAEAEKRQREAARQRREEARRRDEAEAEAQRVQRETAERQKYQELGRESGREHANVFYMRYVRDEVTGILDFMVGLENSRGTMSTREAREQVLRQIDADRDGINQFQINMLREKYAEEAGGKYTQEVLDKLDRSQELVKRLKVARAYMRGEMQPMDLPEAGHNENSRRSFEEEFNKTWDEIAKATGSVDKHKYWFVPLTVEETVVEGERARQWIKTEGRERGKLIRRLMESPQAAEDERFAKQAIRKSEGLMGSMLVSEETVNQQYEWMLQEIGNGNEYQSRMWKVKEAFVKQFKKDKANRGKDIDAEWEVVLFRYRVEAEAMKINKNIEMYHGIPRMPKMNLNAQRSLRTKYDVEDFLVGMPRSEESEKLYNEGLEEGYLG